MDIHSKPGSKAIQQIAFGPSMTATLKQADRIAKHFMSNYMEPLQKVFEVVQEHMKRIIEQARQIIDSVVKPLTFLFALKPIYYVPTRPVTDEQPKRIDRHLAVQQGSYGFFKVDGHQLTVLNPNSSRCGKLLEVLLRSRAQVVDYTTLRKEVKSPDLDKDFKDLKRQLKKKGFELDYDRPRSQGIVYKGIKYLQ